MDGVDKEIDVHDDLHHSLKHIWRVLTNRAIQSSVKWFSLKEVNWSSPYPVWKVGVDEIMVVETRNPVRILKGSKEKLLCSTNLIGSFNWCRPAHLPKVKALWQGYLRWVRRKPILFQWKSLKNSANCNHCSTCIHLDRSLTVATMQQGNLTEKVDNWQLNFLEVQIEQSTRRFGPKWTACRTSPLDPSQLRSDQPGRHTI